MRIILTIMLAAITSLTACAYKFTYSFNNTPIADALVKISEEHPDVNISFIYNELDKYHTSARIATDDAYTALRKAIGLNPISITKKGDDFFIEALQHGRYVYTGQAVGSDNEPVAAATVMLLAPKDSTVATYGITDESGRFSIPCDIQGVTVKISCIGYRTAYKRSAGFAMGKIHMEELPIRLKDVKIEADYASLYSDKSVYRPTTRQKNASQTATDLLVRMAIPQLNAMLGSSHITTAGGQSVAIYIDFVPATADDLRMMRISDVKSVEYYENPSDPRFQGNRYVINFRMAVYQYGGYVKVFGRENFIANSGLLQANARFVKKKMTYDLMGYSYYMSNNHLGIDQTEEFHLPQADGTVRNFSRESLTESSKYRKRNYETSFRALYTAEKVTANSQIAVSMDDTPHNDRDGIVKYSGNFLPQSDFSSAADSRAKNISYRGYYFFSLPKGNSLTASLYYGFSHTNENSRYSEIGLSPISNNARDNTHEGNAMLSYSKSFSDRHSIMAHARGAYEHNRTRYSGSVNALDRSITRFFQIGMSYNFTGRKLSASLGAGWDWMATELNDNHTSPEFPYFDASLNYLPNKKNSFGFVFHYSVWPPSANYKSENIIQTSPFLRLTGNPFLKSDRSYDIAVNYTFIPSNRFNMTAFASTWIVGNRAAFVYEATPEGIVRTIQQPIGSFRHYNFGINSSVNCFDGKLRFSGRAEQLFVHYGLPYPVNRSCISYYLQALYYAGNFNFAISYRSKNATDNYDSQSGLWTKNRDSFILQAGWSNASWNIRLTASNIQRWNWRSSQDIMKSDHYSFNRWNNNASAHAFIQLSATYTFGFGKQVKKGDDISRQSSASSGILK